MSSLLSQLLPHERADLQEDARCPAVANPAFQPWLAQLWDWEGYQRSLGSGDAAIQQQLAAWSLQFPEWTREQVLTGLSFDNARGGASQELGITRRIVHDHPAELAVGICLGARLEWVNRRVQEQSGIGMAEDDALLILLAMPVRDTALIRRVLDSPIQEQDPERRFVYEGVVAAFRRDLDALRPLTERIRKRKLNRSIQGMRTCLTGIAEKDPELVRQGLHELLDAESRLRKRKEGRIISLEAHQFYRLAEWVSPELVSAFDVMQPLPWDAGFHAWTEAHPDPLSGVDLAGISPILHDALIELKLPGWWRVLEEPELPNDSCRLILTEAGPNPKRVREMVEQWCRTRQWDLVDVDRCPAVIASGISRVNAFMMKRSLLEAGASARMEMTSAPQAGV